MEFINEAIQNYAEQHTAAESEILRRINRETYTDILHPRMLSGQLQGRILSMLSKMIKPHSIIEIGTFTGYSAVCLAEGLSEDGKLCTIDINEELEERVIGYFNKAGINSKVDYRIGNALDIIPLLDGPFDLIFIDADKENYQNYFDLIIDKTVTGGIIIADNVLWSGKVLNNDGKKIDKDTQALIKFNDSINNDDRLENVLFPIRDGLMVIRKK